MLIDSPPVLPVTDAMMLSKYADAMLLVVAAGQTRRAELQRAAERLAQANAPVVGIVLNKVTKQSAYGSGYGYGYGYGYGSYAPDASLVPVQANGGPSPRDGTAQSPAQVSTQVREMPDFGRQFSATYSDQLITERSSGR